MHRFTMRRLFLGGLAAASITVAGPRAKAQPPAPPAAVANPAVKVGKAGELLVPLGGAVRFTPKVATFKDVLTGNQEVLDARQDVDPGSILLVGKNPGVTKLTLSYPDGKTSVYEVIVQPDYDLLRKVIARAVPGASVDVIPGLGTAIILTGYVNKPEESDIIVRIAQGAAGGGGNVINAIQVGGVQHVQVEVVVAQVDRSELRNRGADFSVNGTSVNFGSFISGLLATSTTATTEANLRVGIAPAGIFAALRALRSEGLAKFLSEPKVVTQSGRPATIRSGGQQAVLSATGGGLGSISVNLEQVGTSMDVIPIVYGNGKIYLEVSPRVRTRNDGLGIQTSAGFSPGFTEQSTSASVVLESGQTFAIGGLLESSVQGTSNKVPFVGDLPFVGTAFSRVTYDERERELVILVTPRLVDALDCTQVPKRLPGRETRSPDDYEFYLENLLEAPRGQRQVWNGRCYNAAWKCDANGQYPCKGNVCNGPAGTAGGGNCAAGTCTPGALPGFGPAPLAAGLPASPVAGPLTITPVEATTPVVPQVAIPDAAPPAGLPLAPVLVTPPGGM